MAQWLRTEETHMAARDCLQLQFQEIHGDLTLFKVRLQQGYTGAGKMAQW